MEERIIQIEGLIDRLDLELAQARQQLQRAESRARRATRHGRIMMACAGVALATFTAGTASAGAGPRPLTVRAPFNVVSSSGAPLLTVTSDNGGQIEWYDYRGQQTGHIGTGVDGNGTIEVDASRTSYAQLGTSGGKIGLRFFQNRKLVAGMGDSPLGGAVELNAPSGNRLAYLGETADGGVVTLHTPDGTPRALVGIRSGGKGVMEVDAATGMPVARLTERVDGGYLSLANLGGTIRVEGGVLSTDVGVMRTFGPKGFDYIQGRD